MYLYNMHLDELVKLKSYEKIEKVLRRHWFTFVPVILLFIALGLAPGFVYYIFINTNDVLDVVVYKEIAVLFVSVYYLFLYSLFFALFIDFHLDMWIISNDRLIDVNQKGLFSRMVTEVDLYLIQEITSEQHGLFGHIFNYGDVYIQTAGAMPRVVFMDVKNPHGIRNLLIHLADDDRKFHLGGGAPSVKN